MKPSDIVERKFLEVNQTDEWEVLSHDGWRDIESSNLTIPYAVYRVTLENGMTLECADNHILITEAYQEVFAKDSVGEMVMTTRGGSRVVSVSPAGDKPESMYDLTIDGDELFYTNGILSHNTTTTAAVILWHVLFNKEYTVALLANKMEQAQEIMERIQMMYENLPLWIQQGIITWNKRTIKLENDSRIVAAATSSSAIRGKSVNMVYLDEFAHIDRALQLKFFTSTYPVISAGQHTKVVITSTPNGYEMFAKMWQDSIKEVGDDGKSSYVPVSVHWSDIPGRDDAWKQETINNTSVEQFRQEYECEFLGSADTLIAPEYLGAMVSFRPLRKNNNISIFHDPVPGNIYCIVADVARGGGGDFSAFVVVDITTFPYTVAATYRDNTVTPVVYPNFIHQASLIYNNAYVLVEVNDIGGQVADILNYELENETMMMVTMTGKKGQSLGGGFGKTARFGVKTTAAVKRIGCFAIKGLVENNQILVNDYEIIQEFSTFVHDGKNYGAEAGKHDDLVMCLVLFAWATTQKYFKELTDSDVRARILHENELRIEEDMLPFGVIDDGMNEEDVIPNDASRMPHFDRLLL